MKIKVICCLILLIITGSLAAAQQFVQRPPLACSGPPGPPITEAIKWSQFHLDLSHTGCNPHELVLSPATVGNLVLNWNYLTPGAIGSAPAVANGVVYVGSADNNLYALDASTGALLFKGGLS
jgi:hypothetical protein